MLNALEYKDFSKQIQTRVFQENGFVKAQIEVTYGCNLHCVHCYTDPLNKPGLLKKELPTENLFEAVEKFYQEGILWLCFTGGEVFVRKDFLDLYDFAWDKGFLITLFTNGTTITELIADHLAQKPPFSIELSMHGATEETFDRVTQVKGSFRKFLEGWERLLSRKLPVKVKASAMTLNRNELNQIQAFVENRGIEFQMSGILYPRLDGDVSSLQYRLDASEIVNLEWAYDQQHSEKCSAAELHPAAFGESETPQNLYRCGCGKIQLHMDPYGKVGACTWARGNRFDFREKGIQEGMQNLAKDLKSQHYTEATACRACQAYVHCEKVVELAHLESGKTQQPVRHFCEVAFGRLEKLKNWRNHLPEEKHEI